MIRRPGLVLALCLVAMGMLAAQAQAREGAFLGLGLISHTESGDLNGTTVIANPGGPEPIYAGKLGDATGVAFDVGYGFGRFIGIEYWADVVGGTATHQSLNYTTPTTVATQNLGLRFSLPVGTAFEVFARAGVGAYALQYDTYAAPNPPGNSGAKSVLFTGEGTSTGAGIEFYSGHVGFGFSYTVHNVQFNQAKVQGESGQTFSKSLDAQIAASELMLAYHF